ncbi:hypothetical protein KP509_10G056700 [Ceratopteris richardii]|uniref:Uncharacterized protein n=1 Tax=Ceratopteris richardii TaxID=49495 RepID=A0A8T2U1C5_CERRI|nr:hypothetical protein KP509_10G056700 [Ceratopteris richardii]
MMMTRHWRFLCSLAVHLGTRPLLTHIFCSHPLINIFTCKAHHVKTCLSSHLP